MFIDHFLDYLYKVADEGEQLEFIEGFEETLEVLMSMLEEHKETERKSMS